MNALFGQFHPDAPEVLYKFRSDVERDVECLLVDRSLYLASPLDLNDPFDCRPGLRLPDVPDLDDFVEKEVAKAHKGFNPEDLAHRIRLLMTSSEAQERFEKEFYSEDLGKLGVLSLSVPRDHPLLWAHYAGNGSGFCVGYSARRSEQQNALGAWPVEYSNERFTQSPFTETDWGRALHTKSPHWEYEQEWRHVRTPELGGNGLAEVPEGVIKEVCLGPRMNARDRTRVLSAASSLKDKPAIFNVVLRRQEYGVDFVRIA